MNEPASVLDRLCQLGLRAGYRVLRVWWRVRRPVVHGAWVAVWCGDRLLVVRNSYRADLTLPSGGLKRGESPRRAAARELAEEVGLVVSPEQLHLAGEFALDYEGKHDHAHFFELEVDALPEIRIDRREVVAAAFSSVRELDGQPLVPHARAYLRQRAASTE